MRPFLKGSVFTKALALPVLLDIEGLEKTAAGAGGNCGRQKITVGGQAVIEGVMMRGPERWTVTVRRADGRLESAATEYRGWARRWTVLGKPFLRGAVVLLESMIIGIKALNYSAEIAASDEEAEEPPMSEAEQSSQTKTAEAGEKKPSLGFWALTLTLVSAFVMAIALFVALPHAASVLLGHYLGFDESSGLFHLVDGLIKFAVFLGYVWGIGFLPDIGRVYAYHGAEHKAIFTFEDGQPLTPETADRYPAFHPRCGTAFIFLVLALSIIFFAAVFPLIFSSDGASIGRTFIGIAIKIVLMLPLAGIAYEVTRQAGKASPNSFWRSLLWPGLLMQRLTTRKPDKKQLEVALNALKAAVA